jgi:hypothetical protein
MNLLDSVFLVNLIGMFITVILLMFWLRQFIDVAWIRLILLLFFMMAWHVPFRRVFFSPEGTDAWGAVWFVGGLLLLNYMRRSYTRIKKFRIIEILILSLLVSIGYVFRESNAILAIVPFFFLNPLEDLNISLKTMTPSHGFRIIKQISHLYYSKETLILFVPIITVVLTNKGISRFIEVSNPGQYSYFLALFKWFYTKSMPEYLTAVFIAFGPLITLLPFYWRQFKELFYERQDLFLILCISFLFGLVGGSGTERITFMSGFPVMLVLTGIAIRNIYNSSQRWWLYVLFSLQTIAYRFYWTVPDCPNDIDRIPVPFLTMIGNKFNYYYLFASYGNVVLNTIVLMEYLGLFIITLYILHNKVALKTFKIFSQ